VIYFKVLSQNTPGETEENHENPQAGLPLSWSELEPETSRMRRTRTVTTFGKLTDIRKEDNIRDHPTAWHIGHKRLLPLLPFSPYLAVPPHTCYGTESAP
jgi:hypothetical protein